MAGDKCMPELHLKQPRSFTRDKKQKWKPGFTYSTCGPFTKNKERIQKFMQTGDLKNIYKNEPDKACFQHDMVYGDFKDFR